MLGGGWEAAGRRASTCWVHDVQRVGWDDPHDTWQCGVSLPVGLLPTTDWPSASARHWLSYRARAKSAWVRVRMCACACVIWEHLGAPRKHPAITPNKKEL